MPPRGDIDYIIMTNANEEALFWELLSEYRQEYPDLSESEAFGRLVKRLSELVAERKVGIYRVEGGRSYVSPEEYQDLTIDEAQSVLKEEKNWLLPQTATAAMYHLWAQDESYFGQYYGSRNSSES
jgi:hypothetical protein